jgi:hypothetical protein
MLRLFSFSLVLGATIGTFWSYSDFKSRPKIILEPNYDFIKRNETIESSGEKYEIFWPALDKLENLE